MMCIMLVSRHSDRNRVHTSANVPRKMKDKMTLECGCYYYKYVMQNKEAWEKESKTTRRRKLIDIVQIMRYGGNQTRTDQIQNRSRWSLQSLRMM